MLTLWRFLPFCLLFLLTTPSLDAAIDLPPDPADYTLYDCYEDERKTWNDGSVSEHDGNPVGDVEGRIYWPVVCGAPTEAPTEAKLPLVIVIHGDGHHLDDYEYFMEHLAKNGFIAATIDGRQEISNVERAERIRTYLAFMRDHWAWSDHVKNSIGLFGHSRGGEGVVTAARKIREWGLDHDVDAVVSLAPTDRPTENDGTEGPEDLHSRDAGAYLVIYGSKDADIKGRFVDVNDDFLPCNPPLSGPMHTGFSLYDRAGQENNTEPPLVPGTNAITKAMLFVDRATHNCWRFENECFGPWLSGPNHRNVLKAYTSAFFRQHLRGEQELAYYLTGDWTPASVAEDGTYVRQQYSEALKRRVIDNFENGNVSQGTLGPVTDSTFLNISLREDSAFEQNNCSIPHDTGVLSLRWNRASPLIVAPWIRWSIPDHLNHGGQRLRDFSGFSHLSLRAGQQWGDVDNQEGEDQRFSLRLRDDAGDTSLSIPSRLFDALRYPDKGIFSNGLVSGKAPKSSLQTLRFPLAYVHGVDLENIVEVELRFDDPDHLNGAIFLDSLELVDAAHNVLGVVPTELINGLPIADIQAGQTQERYFFIDVPEGAHRLDISIDGNNGDADLYLRYGLEPTSQFFDCRPYSVSSRETCTELLPAAGRWYVMVRGFRSFDELTIEGTFELDGPPCVDCEHYPGHLDFTGDSDLQPAGTWYWSPAPGRHRGWLEGPADTDFDLYLYLWNGFSWVLIASSTSPTSEEEISFVAWQAGYFLWEVYSYSGSGDYDFWLQRP